MRFDVGLPLSVQARWAGHTAEQPVSRHQRRGDPCIAYSRWSLYCVLFWHLLQWQKWRESLKAWLLSDPMLMRKLLWYAASSTSHLQSMTGFLLWTSQQNILLGRILFICNNPYCASLRLSSYLGSLFLPCSVCSLSCCMMTLSWKLCKSSLRDRNPLIVSMNTNSIKSQFLYNKKEYGRVIYFFYIFNSSWLQCKSYLRCFEYIVYDC